MIQKSQIKAAVTVNTQLLLLYWKLGQEIVEKQAETEWGSGFFVQLSKDLKRFFPDLKGFSADNLRRVKTFYEFYSQLPILEQLVPELQEVNNQLINQNNNTTKNEILAIFAIPWGHHVLLLKKVKNTTEALFYVQQTLENNWSRAVLLHQVESNLYQRKGSAVTNFAHTLPAPQSDLAKEIIKDPYQFDFLTLTEAYNERELEKALIQHITQFLLELGAGFSFVGNQYLIKVGEKEYRIDLLFYHLKLRCFVVVELKVVEFEPEFAGKLNFYLNVVDNHLKHATDAPSIGIIICKSKDHLVAEYALKNIHQPIGISEYELNKALPENLKSSLPSIEELENELNSI